MLAWDPIPSIEAGLWDSGWAVVTPWSERRTWEASRRRTPCEPSARGLEGRVWARSGEAMVVMRPFDPSARCPVGGGGPPTLEAVQRAFGDALDELLAELADCGKRFGFRRTRVVFCGGGGIRGLPLVRERLRALGADLVVLGPAEDEPFAPIADAFDPALCAQPGSNA